MYKLSSSEKQALDQQRNEVLQQLEEWLEIPMLVLGLAWLILFIIELTSGLTPLLEQISLVIWMLFILDFVIKFVLAPYRFAYLKHNWLTAISLLIPALRTFRIVTVVKALRTARVVRGLRLLRVMTRTNRGMRAFGASVNRRGFTYVLGLTAIVILVGAAGMYAFESEVANGLSDYSTALWWTAMLMTTMGSDYFPQTPEGRILCFILALYAFAVFGYVTATLATFFIGRDADNDQAEIAGAKSIEALQTEIAALRTEIQRLTHQFPNQQP
jgi:voltage-gated potassium channel